MAKAIVLTVAGLRAGETRRAAWLRLRRLLGRSELIGNHLLA
jgi:hypothetical protein